MPALLRCNTLRQTLSLSVHPLIRLLWVRVYVSWRPAMRRPLSWRGLRSGRGLERGLVVPAVMRKLLRPAVRPHVMRPRC